MSLQIAVATFGILGLELALIRWTSVQIRVFAYFNNIVLICAFMGMGLGVALGRRHGKLVHWVLPALALLAIPLALSEQLQIVKMPFPDTSISLWGAESSRAGILLGAKAIGIFLALLGLIVCIFVFAGTAVGQLFFRIPTLRAYSADLLGSLLGIAAFTVATFLDAGPPVWLFVGGVAFLWLSRSILSGVSLVLVLALGWISVGDAVFSPYNRIDLTRNGSALQLNVNRDFHQLMHDLSEGGGKRVDEPKGSTGRLGGRSYLRDVYDIPFRINKRRDRALIVGAGSGNDAQAALRNGYKQIFSIDIDRKIIELGRRYHPERPYHDKRVTPVVNDARAFFEQYSGPPFDVVCYGLLDSHAMFSSMSSLRLDNFVYTEEGIRAAWAHVADRGHMTISFSTFAGEWMFARLFWTISKATDGKVVAVYHGLHYGTTFIVQRPGADLQLGSVLQRHQQVVPKTTQEQVRTTTDDWPFLYLHPDKFPWGYLFILGVIVLMAVVLTPRAFGRRVVTTDFDFVLFCFGAAFLLIETRGVTSLSLLFGSTWVVNSAVFMGVLVMVLLANIYVQRTNLENPKPWFVALLLSVIFVAFFDLSLLNQLPLPVRGLLGGLINALPIGFAGVIVSILLKRATNPTASLGSNILGSVVGGCCEYLSMFLGLRALVLLALCLYMLALLVLIRRDRATPSPS